MEGICYIFGAGVFKMRSWRNCLKRALKFLQPAASLFVLGKSLSKLDWQTTIAFVKLLAT